MHYLPYASTTNDGNFKSTALQDGIGFNLSANYFPGEQYYYSQTDFEISPVDKKLTDYAQGLNWVGAGKGVSQSVDVNLVSDSVRLWIIGSAIGSIPSTSAIYIPGSLVKVSSIDEAGHSVIEFKDLSGNVILKKVQFAVSPGTAHVGWLSTYYVYDDLDNLRFVIPPRAIDLLEYSGTWNLTALANLTDELCFRYEYDLRNRMIIKKIPGAGEVWMVYDARDRVVMSQDANLLALGKWSVTKYDGQNRPDSTGLWTDANNRTYHQNLASSSIYYPTTTVNFELFTQTYYDDYSWTSAQNLISALNTTYTSSATYFNTTYSTSPTYALPITPHYINRGMMSGSRIKVLGTASQFLATVTFYDDQGRVIQNQGINFTGGKDTVINQYDFTGKVIRNLLLHQKAGTNAQTHSVLSKMNYDAMGHLLTLYKNVDNAGADQLISTNTYNELGQLQNKQLGNSLDNLAYAYNIRGWLSTINKNFITGTPGNYFGMELGYDKAASIASTTYANTQLNGNIAGTVWKSAGDGVNRKYDFTYDNVNRLTAADFNQTTGSTFDKSAGIDFSVSGLSYDGNGNILSMTQKGYKVGGSSNIDQLTYTYQANSNKLLQVNDAANDASSKLGDFHYSGTKQVTDYAYDANGNLNLDNNKAISFIAYNYLNLPSQMTVTSKGTISYTYDASGNKLQKTTVDNTTAPTKTTTTTYLGGIVYQQDTLQFIGYEEGRVRWAYHKYTTGYSAYGFEYDFFEKDHLGNTRIVLTQQKDTAKYLASGEAAYRATESQLFSNIATTAYARPTGLGYPADVTITNPNDTVFRVNGSAGGHKTGPSLLLKVMSGDVLDIGVQSYYSTGTTNMPNSSLTDVIASLATGIVNMASGGKGSMTDLNNPSAGPIFDALNTFLNGNDPNPSGKPKAYLNWILLDEQLKYVSSYPQSGAVGVGTSGTLNALGYTGLPITKSGYLYIWVSNETPGWDVFFDNLSVKHRASPLLEESHYYPFGLTMAGISSKALKPNYAENKYKYNKGSELQSKEFSDGSGLELYATNFRSLDPQLGRFWQTDPKPDYSQSLYSSMNNNPISFNDPLGDTITTSFRTGFLGIFGKKATLTYDEKNQRWNNKNGSAYTGKTTKFSNMVLGDLKTNQKNELGNTIVTNLATDKLDHNIMKGDPNGNRTDNPNIYYNGSASSPDKILQSGQSMFSPSYVTLGHEMAHKFDQNLGIRNYLWFGNPGEERGVDEYNAMYYENVLRQANGLPLRTAYQEANGVTQGVILNANGNLQPMPAGLSSQGVSLPAFHALQLFLRLF